MEMFFLPNSDTLIGAAAASISSSMITYLALAYWIALGLIFLEGKEMEGGKIGKNKS